MIEGMVFNDMNSIASPLVELAKQYDQLPMSELCKSLAAASLCVPYFAMEQGERQRR